MNNLLPSRREVLLSSGGVLVAGSLKGTVDALSQEVTAAKNPHKDLMFRTTDPRNGEPELTKLVNSWQTPTELFYVRSHAPNPEIEVDQFRLSVEGLVRRPGTFSMADLMKMPSHLTTATLTCAGNRRSEYNSKEYQNVPKVSGVQWEAGTIGNATWEGCQLAAILKRVEVLENAKHVWFEGLDQIQKNSSIIGFGGSIPLEKALVDNGPGAPLLAHQMNGQPLTADHGFPLRMVVPGYIGARSVKWLGKIVVSDRPSPNHYVANAYKIVTKTDPLDWAESGPIYRFPINAAICTPKSGSRLSAGAIELTGYALPTGRSHSQIKDLMISADGGRGWTRGKLIGKKQDFCWQLWTANVQVNSKTTELLLRATDSSGGLMPARIPWNAKGYLRNSWYRLPVEVS
jgi:sulfite oxidase